MSAEVIIDGDGNQGRWIRTALDYLPEDIMEQMKGNLVILGVGATGGCRLPDHYREREIVLFSDWVFPPSDDPEGDEAGQFFIIALLHEIAHAVCRHKSPAWDKLSQEEIQAQEDEADSLAIDWFNRHIEQGDNEDPKTMKATEYREIVDRYSNLYVEMSVFKENWHCKNSKP